MKAPIWLLLLLAWNADACQCIHQELAENFPAAEAVVVGQAVASANFCNLTNQKCSGGPGVSLLLRKAVFKDETPVERVYLGSKKLCILDSVALTAISTSSLANTMWFSVMRSTAIVSRLPPAPARSSMALHPQEWLP